MNLDEYLKLWDVPWIHTTVGLSLLVLFALIVDVFIKRILLRVLFKTLQSSALKELADKGSLRFIPWLAHIIPALILVEGVNYLTQMPDYLATIIGNLSQAVVVIMLALSANQFLNLVSLLHESRADAKEKPIKSYIQIAKIAVFSLTTIFLIALMINRSPLILISSLGAAAAVLMFIFQNTLLSFVASVQISTGQLLRIGDWVEMRQQNADGFVIDIALHTVRIQNWDKTITTVPTKNFISESFINWRGMQESGGRRIKRSIIIDQQSIRFLSEDELKRLRNLQLLAPYLDDKIEEISSWNARLDKQGVDALNHRRMTNLGTFRAYALAHLQHNPLIRQDMLMLVRQLSPTAEGLPLEIYCFTDTVVWAPHEAIQSDIFEHLLSIIGEFGLRVYQSPTGHDLQLRLGVA
jgi:miniconductance mechanosensitive channel